MGSGYYQQRRDRRGSLSDQGLHVYGKTISSRSTMYVDGMESGRFREDSVSIILKMKSNVSKGNIFHSLQSILFEGKEICGMNGGFDKIGIWRVGICWFMETRFGIFWVIRIVCFGIHLSFVIVIRSVNYGFDITVEYLPNIRLAKWNSYKRIMGAKWPGGDTGRDTGGRGDKERGRGSFSSCFKGISSCTCGDSGGRFVIFDPVAGEEGLQKIQSLALSDRAPEGEEEDVMETDEFQAALLEHGLDAQTIDALPAVSEEELEEMIAGYEEDDQPQEAGEQANGAEEKNKEATEQAQKQGTRKRLFKPSINVAGSTKMRNAAALVSPRKRAASRTGTRKGDANKKLEIKGSSSLNSGNLKN
ncbi:LOW QUALITY PROTEIN: hypothetical protein HID58_075229 [Brassica napus]|uniref:Uncharacterized protein n=1 Tax=Brassica napus TaxID=3708 RepID=A0ABQ7YJB3_BRANA|nr:LOW QUALITY PROTEIN: hypothetical protein HID58_075229 [Brassica napus]